MSQTVRTRFAPSPTGYLHIGGARTALFNFLLARRLGGKFTLRIEDTDQSRNIAAADQKLMDDLRWLGLQWDEGPQVGGEHGPYYQSQRLERYQQAARQLLDAGKAYYAFDTREELDALRQEAQKAKRSFRYPRPQTLPTHADAERARSEGRPVVVRLMMPGHDITVPDQILGEVTVKASELDDFVIVKGDGWPTYHFAVVVDDADMQVTHVLRGQEHLMNTPNHIALQEALGCPTPAYAHLPIIMNLDGSKMSKREKDRTVRAAVEAATAAGTLDEAELRALSGADERLFGAWRQGETQLEGAALERIARRLHVTLPEINVHDFRVSGFLPEVVLNFIALLGWSPGDGRERLSLDEMIASFAVERIGKTNARFDRDKLLAFNTDAVAAATPERRLAGMRDYLAVNPDSPLAGENDAMLARLMAMKEGFRTFREVENATASLFAPDDAFAIDAAAVQKVLLKGDRAGVAVLEKLRTQLAAHQDWTAAGLETFLRGFCEQMGLGLGKVAQPLRVAVTGTTISPPIFDTLALLGPERTQRRIERMLAHVAEGAEAC